jgi:hypothetical protein
VWTRSRLAFLLIYAQIFGHLHPYDLLRLSRASKALRALVLHKRMKNVWTNALAALNMPPCPLDISEPRYTALAFENICSVSVIFQHIL